jgi:hypothetical protein
MGERERAMEIEIATWMRMRRGSGFLFFWFSLVFFLFSFCFLGVLNHKKTIRKPKKTIRNTVFRLWD